MKFKYLLILILNVSWSQSSDDCINNLSIFAEYYKVKNYDSAYEPWMKVRQECPKINAAIYSYGKRMLDHFIKTSDGEQKITYQNDLIKLYDEWLVNFPELRGRKIIGEIISNKAQAMLDNKFASKSEIYKVFDEAYNKDRSSFDDPKPLYNYFKTYYELYKSNIDGVTISSVFNKYEDISERFEEVIDGYSKQLDVILKKEESGQTLSSREKSNKRAYGINSNASVIYLNNLNAIIAKESTCENLIPLYRKNLDENKDNPVWLNRAASRMDSKDCSDDPLFVELVELLHNLNPSANSAYYLGLLNDKKGNINEALKFYNESIGLETDNIKKARILYKIATKFKKSNQFSKSRNYARKALDFQPSMGSAYLLIANLYASSANNCGNSQFEKRAVYWLAAKEARKAASVDARVKRIAERTAESYEGRAPSKTDIFTEANAGVVIKFNCWIGQSITVPNL
jgi:tetratricopeptide (TPR) repeat protein|tara:strand:- start:8248 stop:9621 length:1374 start_codon:yes stop_codon:yes gene_type:complete